jgi:hypothetical protein
MTEPTTGAGEWTAAASPRSTVSDVDAVTPEVRALPRASGS